MNLTKRKGFSIIKIDALSDGWKKVIAMDINDSCKAYMMQDKDVDYVGGKQFIANSGGQASTHLIEKNVWHDGKAYHVWSSYNTLEYPEILDEAETDIIVDYGKEVFPKENVEVRWCEWDGDTLGHGDIPLGDGKENWHYGKFVKEEDMFLTKNGKFTFRQHCDKWQYTNRPI